MNYKILQNSLRLFLTFLTLSMLGCSDDDTLLSMNKETCTINLSIPKSKTVDIGDSRIPYPEMDYNIGQVMVIVYDPDADYNSMPSYSEIIEGYDIMGNGSPSPIIRINKRPKEGSRIYIIANAQNFMVPPLDMIPYGSVLGCFHLDSFVLENINNSYNPAIPMYGELFYWPYGNYCELKRTLTKVGLELDSYVEYSNEAMKAYFESQPQPTFYVVTNNRSADLFNDYGYDMMWSPSIEIHPNFNRDVYIYPCANSMMANGHFVNDYEFDKERDCLIMKYGDGYFRLDFSMQEYKTSTSSEARNIYIDIFRDHHYIFHINHIFSYGYSTAEEAYQNPASNVEYSIVDINPDKPFVTSNGQYAIATDRSSIEFVKDNYSILNFDLITFSSTGRPDISTAYLDIVDEFGNPVHIDGLLFVEGTGYIYNGVIQLGNQYDNRPFTLRMDDSIVDKSYFYHSIDGKFLRIHMGNIVYKMPIKVDPTLLSYS